MFSSVCGSTVLIYSRRFLDANEIYENIQDTPPPPYEGFNKYQIRSTGSPKRFNNHFESRVSESATKFAQPLARRIKNKYRSVCVCSYRIFPAENVIEKFFIRFLLKNFGYYDKMEYKTELFAPFWRTRINKIIRIKRKLLYLCRTT